MRPNFLGIGAQKCATTWLHAILVDHPEVCMGPKKEIDFFSHYYDYGFQWYERRFHCDGERIAVGEVSPSYFHSTQAPRRVSAYHGDMRLVLFLRDPVERAFSNHKHEVRIGHLRGRDLSFEYGLKNNPAYIEQGLYATHLERWLEHFPRRQLLVVLVDDIVSNPAATAADIYEFLGISQNHVPAALGDRSNESFVSRYRWLERVRDGGHELSRAAHLEGVWRLLARVGGQRLYRRLNRRPPSSVIPPMEEATRRLLKATFRGEMERLETLLERSLDPWR